MKRILTFALVLGYAAATAQKTDNVGIGTTKPDPSAILDLNTTNKGFLMPRMTETERNAIKNPAMALKVYQIDGEKGEYTFDGTTWQPSARVGATNSVGAWDKQGNAIDGTDFLGTTNNFPLVFKVNGATAGQIDIFGTSRNTSIGYESLASPGSSARNVAMGMFALRSTNLGADNLAFGYSSGYNITSGNFNVAIGSNALLANQSGQSNMAIGTQALFKSTSSYNTAIGTNSLYNTTSGSFNTSIGFEAGFSNNNPAGRNVFIGTQSGYNETGTGMLYISNNETANPLLKGNFSSNWLRINSKTNGYLVIGDFDTAISATPGTGGVPLPATAGQNGGYRLVVQDGILCEKLKVALRSSTGSDWADYVFDPEYKLMSLEEVNKYAKSYKHLPNVPSATEISANGIDVAKISKMFMEKIEELTLHVISLNERIKELEKTKK